jgi:copper chaperone
MIGLGKNYDTTLMKMYIKQRYIKYTLKEKYMENLNLTIPAIHCNHCAHTIKMELTEIEGVNAVNVDIEKKEIAVSYEEPANEQEIRNLLSDINYPAKE